MPTTTHYVVRNDEHLYAWTPPTLAAGRVDQGRTPAVLWRRMGEEAMRWFVRPRHEAEALAAEHGGTVVEVTVTERPVGLRWEERASDLKLLDGERVVGSVACDWVATVDEDGTTSEPWLSRVRWALSNKSGVREVLTDGKTSDEAIDEAKAAAEAAVKAGWT